MIILPLLTSVYALSTSSSATVHPERVSLSGAWRLTQTDHRIDIPARVPGTVDSDLLVAGKIPDPFYRDNEKAVQWVGESRWTYTRDFTLTPKFVKHAHILLHCDGLDTLADVKVNGIDVGHADNMFRTWKFDIRRYVHAGSNRIEVDFDPVEPYLKAHEHQAAFPDKPMSGWGYVRKAPFQQGWDFAPKLITCGIWRPISLVGWDEARLTDIGVVQDHSKPGRVGLTVSVDADAAKRFLARITVFYHGRRVTVADAPLAGGKAIAKLTIVHPELWWPAGMGSQNLYNVRVSLVDLEGRAVDSVMRTIGLRTITWIPKTKVHPLTLAVNGRPFFAKGSNWVPCDAVISRASAARERRFVDDAVDAHMNFMRLWGGGYYEDDAFFDECDKKGLMLWSEFKFADAAYPIFDPAWLANVRAEAMDNVKRLRLHPSIAVWSGNNECIGFVSDKTDAEHMSRADYDLLFHQVLPDCVHSLAPEAVYTPGSPESGDDHDWSVWHGGAAFESYRDVHGFMSEFGFQAFPRPKTVDAYTAPADRDTVLSPIMRFHQRNWGSGNAMILNSLKRYYRKPKDFESTLWLSQIQQADGVLTGVEHWRRDWPNSTGSLVWQYDDCWPGASWAMVDYFGRPKALWYRLSHAYAPVMLSAIADSQTGKAELWICNDRPHPVRGKLTWYITRVDGSVIEKGYEPITISSGESSTRVVGLSEARVLKENGAGNVLLWARLDVADEPPSRTLLTFTHPKSLNLIDPHMRASISAEGSAFVVILTAAHPALRAWLDLAGSDARYSDNFVDLLPGEPIRIIVTPSSKLSLASFRKALRIRSLYDTYDQTVDQSAYVAPAADGSIVATADTADIEGVAAYLEDGKPGNIGNWSNVNDYLQWTVKGAKAGTYSVTVNVACPPGEEGSTFVVDVGGSQVKGVVPATKDWWTYTDVNLGKITIANPGDIPIVVRPISKPSAHVMNLRAVTLRPVTSE
jgi:beta-mannosidase